MVMVSAGLSAGERTQGATASCETGTTSNDPDTPGAGVARTCHVIVKSDFWRSDDATRHPPLPAAPGRSGLVSSTSGRRHASSTDSWIRSNKVTGSIDNTDILYSTHETTTVNTRNMYRYGRTVRHRHERILIHALTI